MTLAEMEAKYIERALTAYRGQKRKAAVSLGISSATLYRKIQEYGLQRFLRPVQIKVKKPSKVQVSHGLAEYRIKGMNAIYRSAK